MKYLIIAVKVNGNFDAQIIDEQNPFFNLMVEQTQSLPTITTSNYNVVDKGIVTFNDSDYINNNNSIRDVVRTAIGFRKCDECGAWVTPQDIRNRVSIYDSNECKRYCSSCVTRRNLELARAGHTIRLSGYHDTSCNVRVINAQGETFDLSNVLGIGIEMEANARTRIVTNGNIKVTERFYELANPSSENVVFRCEQDCTVQAEIISNIFTKKSLYDFDWSILTDQLRYMGNDESVDDVGFHVHLSKLWLGDTPKEQAHNFLKLQYFLKSYEEDFFKMSGRKRDRMGWCSFYEMSDIEDMRDAIISCGDNRNPWSYMPSSHSSALISSGATIEFRIGKSTNDPVKVVNYLKFLLGIVENIKNVPFEKCYCIGKVTRLVPNEVMNYWRQHGCFLNTNATNTRGVTL